MVRVRIRVRVRVRVCVTDEGIRRKCKVGARLRIRIWFRLVGKTCAVRDKEHREDARHNPDPNPYPYPYPTITITIT